MAGASGTSPAAAYDCVSTTRDRWHGIIETELSGDDFDAAAEDRVQHPWIIGCQPTGAVIFEAGKDEIVVVVLPVVDRAVFGDLDKLAAFAKTTTVRHVIVCNAGDDGHLMGTAIARACGLAHAYAIDAARSIDRGGDAGSTTPVEVRAFELLNAESISLERRGSAVHGTWRDGATFLCGHPMSFADLARSRPEHAIGKLQLDGADGPDLAVMFVRLKQVIIPANVPGVDATRLANALSQLGVASSVINDDVRRSRRLRVLAHMTTNELDAADALAVEAIAAGDEVVDMHHQRGMIALMRGDDAGADAHLANIDTAQSLTSRALIAARRGEPAAKELALRALARLPGDVIAIRAAIVVHALAGDRTKARVILAEQRLHLDAELVLALERTIDDPPRELAHRFPEHAKLVLEAVKPLIDAGDYAKAEPLLRRAAQWDPENVEIVGDLGFTLSKLHRDDDALAVYNAAIARAGTRQLLRFNRGSCQLRRHDFAAAAADFRACVAIKADWHEARVNLVSALYARGDKQGARDEIDRLKKLGGPPRFVTSLEQMLA